MGNFIALPDGTIFLVNGANTGTAGYGNQVRDLFFLFKFLVNLDPCVDMGCWGAFLCR
jgi:hypothetical protein